MNLSSENKLTKTQDGIVLHDKDGFNAMRKAGNFAAKVLDYITPYIEPGITTEEIDNLCHEYQIENNTIPAPLGYRGFPKSICTSVNHVVCHGIPGNRILKDGDIINIDVSPILNGWYGDTSRMFCAGNVKIKAKKLIQITYDSMFKGIETVRPGATLGDIGYAIQNYAEKHRYSIVRDFCGHGIGKFFHGPPNVMHYGEKGQGTVLEEGMIFTIEPMVNAGSYETKILDDGWTAVTRDRSLSAQFEHTIGVTTNGFEIFTLSPKGFNCPPYRF